MALPCEATAFEAAVMPLVLFIRSDPARGVAMMARVVAPGELVAASAWDRAGGGFPDQQVRKALVEVGITTPGPPSPDASRLDGDGDGDGDGGALGQLRTGVDRIPPLPRRGQLRR